MARILVSDPIAEAGIEVLRQAGEVDVRTGLPKEELLRIIGEYDALVVRSETKVTADVIEAATRLRIIGRAGVGVDNIDVAAATQRGIIVVNSPEGNTIAAAELDSGDDAGDGTQHPAGRPQPSRRRVEAQQVRGHRGLPQDAGHYRAGQNRQGGSASREGVRHDGDSA